MNPQSNAPSPIQRWGAFYLTVQASGALIWWLALWFLPASRALFRPHDAPDVALFSFFLPDALLLVGAGVWAASALWRAPSRALIPLALHAGAAGYAALYCLQQWLMTGEALWAALLMAPALVVEPFLLWICSRA